MKTIVAWVWRKASAGPDQSAARLSLEWMLPTGSKRLSGIAITAAVAGLLPGLVHAQNSNQALNSQLEVSLVGGANKACGRLLGTDVSGTVLVGGLQTICQRGVPASGPGDAAATGANSGTATTLPTVIKKRLEEQRGEEQPKEQYQENAAIVEKEVAINRRVSLFLSAEGGIIDRDVTFFEDGYDSNIWRVTGGFDVEIAPRAVVGLAINHYQQDGDFTDGGNFDVKSTGVIAFGSYLPTDTTFVQFSGGYARNTTDRTRTATFTQLESGGGVDFSTSGTPATDFSANEYRAGGLAGYDFIIKKFTIGPRLGIEWVRTDFDTFSEVGDSGLELVYHDDQIDSLQTTLGVQGSAAFSTSFGVVVPQVGITWKHEFLNDQRDVQVSFVGDTRAKRFIYQTESPDRDFFDINAGVVIALPMGIQTFANVRTLAGHSFFNESSVTIGARFDL